MASPRHVTNEERRRRLARRHALTPSSRVKTVDEVTRAMTVLHATEPATVYLSCRARADVGVDDVDRALYETREVAKQLAMRRTLFVFPHDLLPAAWGSASTRTARGEAARVAKDVESAGIAPDGAAWLVEARGLVLALLAEEPDGLPAQEIRARIPFIDVRIGGGSVWSASRVLTHLGATGDVMRARNTGHWRTSRPRWTRTEHWLHEVSEPSSPEDGYRELVRRWLGTFGPGTEADLVWWLGATKTVVRRALAELDAVQVSLDGGGTGWLLPDDLDEPGEVEPWAALLPVLDPTVMGWKERDFYLDPSHVPHLFDRNGNAGTTAWVDGRAVGCWVQDEDAAVEVRLCVPVSAAERALLAAEAARLTEWLDSVRVGTVYPSIAMKTTSGSSDAKIRTVIRAGAPR